MSRTFVLMHGAWHGGWCWAAVADILRARGHRVTTPTQTGLGERRHLMSPDITVATFIDDLANHIQYEDLSDVTLVGHSFGGLAVSGTAELMPERIRNIIYLDCTMLRGGECMADYLTQGEMLSRIRTADSSGGVSVPPPPAHVFGVLDPAMAEACQARLTPHPLRTFQSPLPINGLPGNALPARYIACMDPGYHKPGRVTGWCDAFGLQYSEIATGHDAMITAPEVLSEMLEQ